MAYITCTNLSLGYDGKIIVSGLNFSVNRGDYLCIVGENGTGKTTLMKTLLNLQNAQSGEIRRGDDLQPYEIGYLPQQTAVQKDFPATVWEVVLSGTLSKCGKRPFYSGREKRLAEDKMKELGIWELQKKCYRHLSGGQQQRTLLARALCAATRIILLDEPITGLDPIAAEEFYRLLKVINQKGVAVIMISHDLQAITYATHILHIDKSESYFGTKEEYLKQEIGKNFIKAGGKRL